MARQEGEGDWGVRFSSATNLAPQSKMEDIEKIYLHIEGMTCASCVASIEKALTKKKGMPKLSICLSLYT